MKLDPKPRAQLFTEHDPVMRYRYYQKLKKLGAASVLQAIESREQDLLEFQQQHDRFKTKYPEGKGWWGNTIAWLARRLGKGAEEEYSTVYWMESNLVHTNVVAMKEYLHEQQGSLRVNCYSSQSDNIYIPREATLYFLDIMRDVADALELNLSDDVAQAHAEFKRIDERFS